MSTGTALHRYQRPDGAFDYDAYVAAQIAGNARKLGQVFARQEILVQIAQYIQARDLHPRLGICHGTRRGREQRWFRQYLPGCEVFGTEIAPTCQRFPFTIQCDFHEPRPEWIGAAQFVYSNSLDHAYDPERALNTWMESLSPGGLCFIEHTTPSQRSRGVSETDPFWAPLAELSALIAEWGVGRYEVREIMVGSVERRPRNILVIEQTTTA